MTDMRAGGASPSIGDLINSGVDYAKSAKATIPYVAVTLAAMILPAIFGPTLGGILALVSSIGLLFLSLMASREAIAGTFAYADSDLMGALKLLGLALVAGVIVMIIGVPLAFLLFGGLLGAVLFGLALLAIMLAIIAYVSALLPAFAMADETPIMTLFERTRPYWIAILCTLLAFGVPGVVIGALAGVGGALGLILQIIGAVVSGALAVASIGAISRLYATRIRAA
jgi:hypothetical protein